MLVILLSIRYVAAQYTTPTFHLRHFSGGAVGLAGTDGATLIAQRIFRHKFQWRGLVLFHMSTMKCLVPRRGSTGNMTIGLTDQCNSTDAFFKHDSSQHWLKHLLSGQCVQLHGSDNYTFTLGSDCQSRKSQFRQVAEVLYTIRHIKHLCLIYDDAWQLFRLQKNHACDRFVFSSEMHLRHYKTGKCVHFSNSYIRLSDDCQSNLTMYDFLDDLTIKNKASGKCIQPIGGAVNPGVTSGLDLVPCGTGDQFKFPIYQDRGISISFIRN